MTYAEAMGRYGSDKPDLRFDMPLYDVTAFAAQSEFKVFREAATKGKIVKALIVKAGGEHREESNRCARRNRQEFWGQGPCLAEDHG